MANRNIEVPTQIINQIRQQALAAAPRECCGLIEGRRGQGHFRVTALHPARNLAKEADEFDIDPSDHIAAAKAARGRGNCIIGCYHSHPNGRSEPSARDLEGASQEDFLWLIATGDGLGAFVYSCGGFSAEDWTMSSE